MAKIDAKIAQNIIDLYLSGYTMHQLQDRFGIWATSIGNLIRGDTWKECWRPNNILEITEERKNKTQFKKGRICYRDCPPLTQEQYDVLIGSMLGDGGVYGMQNYAFSKPQAKTKKDYVKWHYEVFGGYSSAVDNIYSEEKLIAKNGLILERRKVRKHLSGYRFRTCSHPEFTKIRNEWYKDSIKIIPNNLTLNPLRIAVWYFDDGSNCLRNRIAVICTQCFTMDESMFLVEKLKDFDLFPYVKKVISQKDGKIQPILAFSKKSYDNLINLVKPYMLWDCFKYKVEWKPAKKQWEVHGKFTEEQINQILELRKTQSSKEISAMFGVHVNTIYRIVSNRSWKHLRTAATV